MPLHRALLLLLLEHACDACREPGQPTWTTRWEPSTEVTVSRPRARTRDTSAGLWGTVGLYQRRCPGPAPLADTAPGLCLRASTGPVFPHCPPARLRLHVPHKAVPTRPSPARPAAEPRVRSPSPWGGTALPGAWTGLPLPEQPREPRRHDEGEGPAPGHRRLDPTGSGPDVTGTGTSTTGQRGAPSDTESSSEQPVKGGDSISQRQGSGHAALFPRYSDAAAARTQRCLETTAGTGSRLTRRPGSTAPQ